MLMTFDESINACKKIDGWKFVTSFSVGGLEWLGFSKESLNKMIIISSQKSTILDCSNGKLEDCTIGYDEEELIALCDKLSNEQISIAGQYGGELPVRIPVKRRARSGGTVRSFQCKRRSRSIPNGVKRRPSVLSDQRSQFLTELRPLVS